MTVIEKPTASSLAILLEFTIGMFSAPSVYGLMIDTFKNIDKDGRNVSRAGAYVIFFSPVIGVLSLTLAIVLRNRSKKAGE